MEDKATSLIFLIIYIATLIHVFIESRRMKDAPIRNTLMVAICIWPLGYLFWIFYWPGSFWKKLTGRKPLEPSTLVSLDRKA